MSTIRKKLLDYILLFNFDQTQYKITFLQCKKIRKSQKVTWLKNLQNMTCIKSVDKVIKKKKFFF